MRRSTSPADGVDAPYWLSPLLFRSKSSLVSTSVRRTMGTSLKEVGIWNLTRDLRIPGIATRDSD